MLRLEVRTVHAGPSIASLVVNPVTCTCSQLVARLAEKLSCPLRGIQNVLVLRVFAQRDRMPSEFMRIYWTLRYDHTTEVEYECHVYRIAFQGVLDDPENKTLSEIGFCVDEESKCRFDLIVRHRHSED